MNGAEIGNSLTLTDTLKHFLQKVHLSQQYIGNMIECYWYHVSGFIVYYGYLLWNAKYIRGEKIHGYEDFLEITNQGGL